MARPKKTRYQYHARIDADTLPHLRELAKQLGFLIDHPGAVYGDPSPPALLDAISAAYARDPLAVEDALRGLGIVGEGLPR